MSRHPLTDPEIRPDSAARAEPITDSTTAIESVAGDSPLDAPVPFWVTACVRLTPPTRSNGSTVGPPADKVLTAVQVLMADRVRTADDTAVELNRSKIARWCGYDSPKKAAWILDYLSAIGFLQIEQHYVPGRRGRAADTFTVFSQPPLAFIGPRDYAQLDRALCEPTPPRTLFAATPRRPRAASQVPGGTPNRPIGSQVDTQTGKTAGQRLDHQPGTNTAEFGSQVGTETHETAGQGLDHRPGTFLRSDRSISFGDGSGSIEPVPGRAAEPPATGRSDDGAAAELVSLVRRLGWREWADRHDTAFVLNAVQAAEIRKAIGAAIAARRCTLVEAELIAVSALAEAKTNPARYVAQSFGPRHLERRLRTLLAEPLDENPLPLPALPAAASAKPAKRAAAPAPAPTPPDLPACDTCGAAEDATSRWVESEDGRGVVPCPDCRPRAAQTQPAP